MQTYQKQERLIQSLYDLSKSDVQVTIEHRGRKFIALGWEDTAEGKQALDALAAAWSMDKDHGLVWIGDIGLGLPLSHFVEWVMTDAEKSEIFDLAIQLIEFRRLAKVERVQYALVPGVLMDLHDTDHFKFHDGTVLAPMAIHPDRELADHYSILNCRLNPIDECHLYLGFSTPETCHFGKKSIAFENRDFQRMQDIAMCVNLCRPIDGSISLQFISNFFYLPYLRFGGHSWYVPYSRKSASQNFIVEHELCTADGLYNQLIHCDEKLKDRIRVAARYLSHMGMAEHLEDKLISLRVALEAIFCEPPPQNNQPCAICNKPKKGQRWSVSTRASHLLGGPEEQQKELKKLFGDVYDMLSGTAHSGRLSSKYDRDKVDRAADLLRQTIGKLIELGEEPDWDAMHRTDVS